MCCRCSCLPSKLSQQEASQVSWAAGRLTHCLLCSLARAKEAKGKHAFKAAAAAADHSAKDDAKQRKAEAKLVRPCQTRHKASAERGIDDRRAQPPEQSPASSAPYNVTCYP